MNSSGSHMNLKSLSAETIQALTENLSAFATEPRMQLMRNILEKRTRHLTIAVENMYQPHNASAVIRTSECFGIQDVHVIEKDFSFRPSRDIVLGSAKWLTLTRHSKNIPDTAKSCLTGLKEKGYRIVATSLKGNSIPIQELDITQKTAVFFGTERMGLSDELLQVADEHVYIPMRGFTQSYNVSVSVALCLGELCGRLFASDIAWQLSSVEKRDLFLDWLIKTVPRGKSHVINFLKLNGLSDADVESQVQKKD